MQIRPTREEFKALAAGHRVVPVWAEVLADLTTPVAAFARVVGDGEGFLLESVDNGDTWSRWSFIGRNPQATIVSKDGELDIIGDVGIDLPTDRGMLNALEILLEEALELHTQAIHVGARVEQDPRAVLVVDQRVEQMLDGQVGVSAHDRLAMGRLEGQLEIPTDRTHSFSTPARSG